MKHQQMIDTVAQRICHKNNQSKACEREPKNNICKSLSKCVIAEKSKEQLDYVLLSSKANIFLRACPGSGKTEIVGLKAAYEFNAWEYQNCGIAILTFTNNAADVIRERVQQYAGIKKAGHPHFVGTMDSWLHGYLAHPFGYLITGYRGSKDDGKNDRSIQVVDDSVSEGWINHYKCRTPYWYLDTKSSKRKSMPLFTNMLRYDPENNRWEIKIPHHNEYRTDNDYFDSDALKSFRLENPWLTLDYMRRGFSEGKDKFLLDGFATYHDVEWICYRLLKEKDDFVDKLSQRFPFIIVDECQDLSWIQLEILGLLKQAGAILHFVGDLNQAIYEFKKVDPKKVKSFLSDHHLETREITDNFRSCQPIVDLCQKLVGCTPVVGKEALPDKPSCVCFYYGREEEISDLPIRFEAYLKQIHKGIDVSKSVILARGWPLVYKLRSLDQKLSREPSVQLALSIFLWSKRDINLTDEALKYLGRFMTAKYFEKPCSGNTHHYCPKHVSSPMHWRLFLSRILEVCLKNDSGISDLSQTWTTWANCVRNNFSQIATSCLSVLYSSLKIELLSFEKLNGTAFQALRGSGSDAVVSTLTNRQENSSRIKITTIHSVKGQTFDAVLLVSSPSKKGRAGGHWSEWLADQEKEHARFAYVASSRPKILLAWAIPVSSNSTDDLVRMKKLGFDIMDTASLTEML